jgi:CheY-like chemotaxis protein
MNSSICHKLFIIDDDEATRILIRGIFEGANIIIIESDCGNEAFKLFKKYSGLLDLIVLDIHLPEFNGWELLNLFRQENKIIPIIALSAMSPKELSKKSQIAGFNACISKPFEILELRDLILSFLRNE